MINVKEIHEMEKRRHTLKKEMYTKIYEDISRKIRNAVAIGHKQIIVKVPSYIFGFPSYDLTATSKYIKRQLTNSGFTAHLLNNGEIYVSWSRPSEHRDVPRHTPPEEEEDFPTFVNLKKIANKLRKQ